MVIQTRRYTVDEFKGFISQPENRDRLFELINGEIVEKMPTREHGIIALNFGTAFNLYLRQNPIGLAAVEARHRPAGDDHNDRLPDVSIVLDTSKPVERKGATPYIPAVIVEIKPPDDTYLKMSDLADFYLANGTRMVILAYPEKRLLEVRTPDERQLLNEDDTLDGGDVLPGFKLPVKDIFNFD